MTTPISTKRKFLFSAISVWLTFLLLWVVAEIAFRALVYQRSLNFPTQTTEIEKTLGWQPVPNFNFEATVLDAADQSYEINFQTDKNGFKYYGNLNAFNSKRILVFGDSYTHAIEVSNDKTYYGLLADSLKQYDFQLYAYGARGIGPLQQKLWLQDWLPKIKPDIVLWQFCFNDVFNSSYDLEHHSYFNNNRRVRPYLENNKVVYRNPARLGAARLREFSKFIDFVFTKIEVIIESNDHKKKVASEDKIIEMGKAYPPYAKGLEVLDFNIKNIKSLIGNEVDILTFPVDTTQPYLADMTAIFEKNGLRVASRIPSIIASQEVPVFAKDQAHWNEKGHEIASEEIWKSLKTMITKNKEIVQTNY